MIVHRALKASSNVPNQVAGKRINDDDSVMFHNYINVEILMSTYASTTKAIRSVFTFKLPYAYIPTFLHTLMR